MRREGRRGATRSGAWLLATTARRSRAQWRLLLGVIAVAVLASVLVTTLSLLVSATEQGGVRGALSAVPGEQTRLGVRLIDPTVDIADARADIGAAVDDVFGAAATATSTGIALSTFQPVTALDGAPPPGILPTFAYLGEYDRLVDNATLVTGAWPADAASGATTVEVAIPSSAASALELGVGSTISVQADDADATAVVTGVFEPRDPAAPFWGLDRLAAAGYDPQFPDPFTSFFNPTVVLGPLVVGAGGLASAGVPVSFLDLVYAPDFSATTVDQVQPLLDRLRTADVDIPYAATGVAGSLFVETDAAASVSAVTAGLVVTRSTVVVVSLLLVMLAIAAMAQLARLFSDARAGERQLMRARGASRRNILALAAVEAVLVAAVAAAATPPLASLAYRLLAAQPPMVAAGMPADAGLPAATWAIAGGISLVFVLVLVAPVLRGDVSFAEGAQAAGRQRRSTGIARSGVDVAVVVLAGVAYWQLQSYRSPVREGDALAIDPVLVAGPAIVLVAAALVCVRLIPAASRLLERVGSGSRGATIALASWEIGRRSQRATAAVLLLSLTLAVGTFGISFLSTWKQSQVDQADFAVGAPVRVQAEGPTADGAPAAPGGEAAAPTIRRPLLIGGLGGDEFSASGNAASVLGLTEQSRGLLDRGRLGELGGSELAGSLSGGGGETTAADLPAGASGLSATVRVGDPADPLPGVAVDLDAIVESDEGLVVLVPLGRVDADGADHDVLGEFATGAQTDPPRFVGFQARFVSTIDDDAPLPDGPTIAAADVLARDLSALVPDAAGDTDPAVTPLDVPPSAEWFGSSSLREPKLPPTDEVPEGWQLRLGTIVQRDLRGSNLSYALVGWKPNVAVPTVVNGALADRLSLGTGDDLAARTGGIATTVHIVAVAPLVPGSVAAADLYGPTPALSGAAAPLAVVDTTALAHSLVEAGGLGPFVDEWWVDVPRGDAGAYLAALPDDAEGVGAALLGERLQQSPLRVATQAALWVAIAASTLLAAVGFGVHSAAGLRSRRLELAQLRAIGYSRRGLVALIGAESLLMCVLGAVFGVTIGVLLALLVGPLVAVSPTGAPTVPSVVVEVPALGIALLLAEVVAVLAAVVTLVARTQRFTEPAHLLREGVQP